MRFAAVRRSYVDRGAAERLVIVGPIVRRRTELRVDLRLHAYQPATVVTCKRGEERG